MTGQNLYQVPIEELELSIRTYNCLKRSNVTKVGQILEMTREELFKVRNFGEKSYYELRFQLFSHGFLNPFRPVGPFVNWLDW